MTSQPTPTRPYFLRALYEWMADNQLTPYLVVDAERPHVQVPRQHVKDGQITLNILTSAVRRLEMGNEAITFEARFGGVPQALYVPMSAVIGLYARENGQGLFFDAEEYADASTEADVQPPADSAQTAATELPAADAPKKPSLRVLD